MSRRNRKRLIRRRPVKPARVDAPAPSQSPRIASDASGHPQPTTGPSSTLETQQNASTSISGPEPLVYTVLELAHVLRVSRSTVDRLNPPGRVRIGGQVRYVRSAIVAWLESQIQGE